MTNTVTTDEELLKAAEKTFGVSPDIGPLREGLVMKRIYMGVIYLADGRIIKDSESGPYFDVTGGTEP